MDLKIPPPPTPWEIPTGPRRTEPASRRGTCLYHIGYGKRKEGQEKMCIRDRDDGVDVTALPLDINGCACFLLESICCFLDYLALRLCGCLLYTSRCV